MPQTAYTYQDAGVTAAYLAQQMPGTGTVSPAVPIRLQTVTWDSSYKDDLDAIMISAGWVYAFQGSAPVAKTILQVQTTVLAADASTIATASGWVNVATRALTTRGGSVVAVQATAVADTTGGQAQARILVNGGAFAADTVIGADQYDIHDSGAGAVGFNHPVAVPDTSPDETTYTFALQMRVTGALSTVIPKKGSIISAVEHR